MTSAVIAPAPASTPRPTEPVTECSKSQERAFEAALTGQFVAATILNYNSALSTCGSDHPEVHSGRL